ncbi:unnamed protein product [Ixodes persulcatus]
MSSCGTDAVGDGEMVPKELLRVKEEELKIVKGMLRKSEATCRRLTLALLDKIEIARDRVLQEPCCQAPLEGAAVAKSISLPSTSTAAPDSLPVEMQEEPPHPSSAAVLPSSPGCSPNDGGPHQEEGASLAAPAPAVSVPAIVLHESLPPAVPKQRLANGPPVAEPKLFDVIDGHVYLSPGVSLPLPKFNLALSAKTDSKCVIEASRCLWTQEQLASRSVTGTACRNKPGSKAKREASPEKMEALRNLLERYVSLHPRANEVDVVRVAALGDLMTNYLTDCGRRVRKRLEMLAAKEATTKKRRTAATAVENLAHSSASSPNVPQAAPPTATIDSPASLAPAVTPPLEEPESTDGTSEPKQLRGVEVMEVHTRRRSAAKKPMTDTLFNCCFCAQVTGDQRGILTHLVDHGDEQLKC